MTKSGLSLRNIPAWAAISCGVLLAGTVVAQTLSEVVVTAERQAQTTVVGRGTATGAPVELVTLTHRVSYADLDLVKHADVLKLQERVQRAATVACKQLDKLYPLTAPQSGTCISKAVEDANSQVQHAVELADGGASHN